MYVFVVYFRTVATATAYQYGLVFGQSKSYFIVNNLINSSCMHVTCVYAKSYESC